VVRDVLCSSIEVLKCSHGTGIIDYVYRISVAIIFFPTSNACELRYIVGPVTKCSVSLFRKGVLL